MKRSVFVLPAVLAGAVLLSMCLAGCGRSPEPEPVEIAGDVTDEMWEDEVTGDTICVFVMDGETYTADSNLYEVDVYGAQPLEDGSFYELTADVTYLNGGVAGYVDFPEIGQIHSCEEISPLDLGLPDITENRYGLLLIGDYAEGDVFLGRNRLGAVWKDGEWIWSYENMVNGEDGTLTWYRDGISEAEIRAGVDSGVLACEDYFVMPPEE